MKAGRACSQPPNAVVQSCACKFSPAVIPRVAARRAATSTDGSAERRTRQRAPRSGKQGEAGCGGRRDALSTLSAECGIRRTNQAWKYPRHCSTWQRCQCHMQRNAFHRAPTAPVKKRIGAELREVWNAQGIEQAQAALDELAEAYRPRHPKFADWLEHNAPERLAVFSLPEAHRRKMRTTNGIERAIQQELKRRTRKSGASPTSTPSCASLQASLSRSTGNGSPERPMSNGREKMTDRQPCVNFQTSLYTISLPTRSLGTQLPCHPVTRMRHRFC